MKFLVLYSQEDEAGRNIAECLKEEFVDIPIIKLEKESIFNENIDKDKRVKNYDFIVFATKHQSKAQVPSLSVHAPGNWRNADFGGKQGKVCLTSSQVLKFLFQQLNKNSQSYNHEHNITMEVTHHGPYIEKPCCFIEIGSTKENWQNKELGKILAKTIIDLIKFKPKKTKELKTAIGIGGLHYCNNFNKIQLNNKEIAISHIIPEYCLPLTQAMLEQAINKTQERIDLILLDWKGIGKSEDRQNIIKLVEQSGIDYKRTSNIEK